MEIKNIKKNTCVCEKSSIFENFLKESPNMSHLIDKSDYLNVKERDRF